MFEFPKAMKDAEQSLLDIAPPAFVNGSVPLFLGKS